MVNFRGVDHVAGRVADMRKSLRFYRDLLGFSVVLDTHLESSGMEQATGVPGVRVHNVMLHKDTAAMIELVQVESPVVRDAEDLALLDVGGIFVISLNVDDIRAAYAELSEKRVKFRSDIAEIEVPGLGMTSIVFRSDPDGVAVELVEAQNVSLNTGAESIAFA